MAAPVASGTYTIVDFNEGIHGRLTNDAVVITTAADGSGGNYTGAGGTFTCAEGQTDVTTGKGVVYSLVSAGTGLTATIHATTGVYTASLGNTTDSGNATFRATYKGMAVDCVYTLSKSKAGAQGPSISVNANRSVCFTATDGALDGSQADIVFTATPSGITNPTYVWTFSGFQTAPTNSGASTQAITSAQFGTAKSATVTCTVSGSYANTQTVFRLEKSTASAGATVGATWGINLGGQPTSLSGINSSEGAKLSGVAAGATKNQVYVQTSQPTGASNGDTWVCNGTPAAIYLYNGGWNIAGNNTTNTNQLTDGAGLGSSAVWSNVTGANKPADNADSTSSALNAGTTITGGGITLSNGGAVKGGQTDYNTGVGFFLGYSSGYKFSVGDPAGKYLRWSGGALEIGGELITTSNLVSDAAVKTYITTQLDSVKPLAGKNFTEFVPETTWSPGVGSASRVVMSFYTTVVNTSLSAQGITITPLFYINDNAVGIDPLLLYLPAATTIQGTTQKRHVPVFRSYVFDLPANATVGVRATYDTGAITANTIEFYKTQMSAIIYKKTT